MISPRNPARRTNLDWWRHRHAIRTQQAQSVQHDPTFVETSRGLDDRGLTRRAAPSISMVLLGTLNYLDGMKCAQIVKIPATTTISTCPRFDYEQGAFTDKEIKAAGHGPRAETIGPAVGQHAGDLPGIIRTGKIEAASDREARVKGMVY